MNWRCSSCGTNIVGSGQNNFFLVRTSCGLRKQIVIIYCFYVLLCQDFLCGLISVFLWYINWLPGCEITWVSVCVFNDAFLFTETFCMSLWSRQGSLWALWLPPYVFVHKLQKSAFSGVCLFTDVDFFVDILGMSGLGMGNQESFVDWSCSIVEYLTSLYGVCVLSRTIKNVGGVYVDRWSTRCFCTVLIIFSFNFITKHS